MEHIVLINTKKIQLFESCLDLSIKENQDYMLLNDDLFRVYTILKSNVLIKRVIVTWSRNAYLALKIVDGGNLTTDEDGEIRNAIFEKQG